MTSAGYGWAVRIQRSGITVMGAVCGCHHLTWLCSPLPMNGQKTNQQDYSPSDSDSYSDLFRNLIYELYQLLISLQTLNLTFNAMRGNFLALFLFLVFNPSTKGQLFDSDVYNVNPWIDGAITIGAFTTNWLGLEIVDKKTPLDSLDLARLDPMNVNAFDRSALYLDPSKMQQARDLSDYGMTGSFFLPVLLLLDKEIRSDWAPVLLLFLESEAIVGNLFSWGAAIHIDRIRPVAYYEDVDYLERTFYRNKNSFYSGHTSSSATASFFVAKVYCDYHPELGAKKFIFYGLAAIPPVFTGINRYRGLKHFPTDVLTGLTVGAATGILVPHLHKKKNQNLVILPVTGNYTGFAMSLKF
jgi:membrane-associated phospholipid phosphatase